MDRPHNSTLIGLAAAATSVGVAGLAAWGVLRVLSDYQQTLVDASSDGPMDVPVVVALREIPVGRTISAEDLTEMMYRDAYIPPSALLRAEHTVGRVARERILPKELVREERLAPPGMGGDLDAVIASGMRAESINISGSQQVSGFVNAGNRVDVITTLFDSDGKPAETRTLLQAVRVLAVDDRAHEALERGVKLKPQVTLEIPPDDAEKLTHAIAHGRVRLVLRSDVDFMFTEERQATTTSELLGGTDEAQRMTLQEFHQAGGSSPGAVVRIVNGTEETVERVR